MIKYTRQIKFFNQIWMKWETCVITNQVYTSLVGLFYSYNLYKKILGANKVT